MFTAFIHCNEVSRLSLFSSSVNPILVDSQESFIMVRKFKCNFL